MGRCTCLCTLSWNSMSSHSANVYLVPSRCQALARDWRYIYIHSEQNTVPLAREPAVPEHFTRNWDLPVGFDACPAPPRPPVPVCSSELKGFPVSPTLLSGHLLVISLTSAVPTPSECGLLILEAPRQAPAA